MLNLSVDEARERRWVEGRAVHGGGAFVGDPYLELYEELLDALNYIEEAIRQGAPRGGPQLLQRLRGRIDRCALDLHDLLSVPFGPPFESGEGGECSQDRN